MAAPQDYYEVLGVQDKASAQELRSAYETAAARWHPDANPMNMEATRMHWRVTEAFAVLSDPPQRRGYDARRRTAPTAPAGNAWKPPMPKEWNLASPQSVGASRASLGGAGGSVSGSMDTSDGLEAPVRREESRAPAVGVGGVGGPQGAEQAPVDFADDFERMTLSANAPATHAAFGASGGRTDTTVVRFGGLQLTPPQEARKLSDELRGFTGHTAGSGAESTRGSTPPPLGPGRSVAGGVKFRGWTYGARGNGRTGVACGGTKGPFTPDRAAIRSHRAGKVAEARRGGRPCPNVACQRGKGTNAVAIGIALGGLRRSGYGATLDMLDVLDGTAHVRKRAPVSFPFAKGTCSLGAKTGGESAASRSAQTANAYLY